MPPLKIAVDLSCLHLPFKQALLAAKRLGAAAVEIDARGEINPQALSQSGRRQLRKLLDDLDLRVAAVSFRTRRGYDVPHDLQRRIEATKRAMEFAYSLGASLVVNSIGRVPEKSEGPAWTTLIEALADLGGYGQHVGASLAAETGGESGADLARLLAALPPGSLAVCLNPGNLIINGFSPLDAIQALGADIRYVHAKDGVRDLAQGRGIETPLGRGAADFPALCGALEEHGYRGYWTIQRERAENPLAEIGQAVSYLQSL
ncbi:MAG TPA: sugar phosphate isomerase/epimerase family protein [Pirellulales bacterium]|nr:sugar phosphate isomerase/epimerase family protein [Pirellulales bacterium]